MVEWYTLWQFFVFALGAGIFLRIAAKDTRRREKYLLIRLEKQQYEEELEENRRKMDEEAEARRQGAPEDATVSEAA